MRIINTICRLLVGLLFIFSGFIKLNDPKGFGYKLNDYFDVFSKDMSAVQPVFKFSLFDAGKLIAEDSIQLYRTETSRKVEMNSSVEEMEEDSNGNQTFVVKLYGVHEGNAFYSGTFNFIDSSEARSILAKVTIGNTLCFTGDYKFSVAKELEFSKEIDLKQYIKKDIFLVQFFQWLKDYSVLLSIIICVLEIVLGIALLIGWKPVLVSWLLVLLMVFFTFLTGYSYLAGYGVTFWPMWLGLLFSITGIIAATTQNKKRAKLFGIITGVVLLGSLVLCKFTDLCFTCAFTESKMKVTDCGCFGDFVKIKPWVSFWKDIALMFLIVIIFISRHKLKSVFSQKFGMKVVLFFTLVSTSMAIYFHLYLPMIDFLPYKAGSNLCEQMAVPKGQRALDSVKIFFKYKKGSEVKEYEFNKQPSGWDYVSGSQRQEVIIPRYVPPIHDFIITDPETGQDITRAMLDLPDYKLVLVHRLIAEANNKHQKELNALAKEWMEKDKLTFWALTASSDIEFNKYRVENQVPYKYLLSDGTMLKTMIRSNPGLLLMKGCKVIAKWPFRNLPSHSEVKSYMK